MVKPSASIAPKVAQVSSHGYSKSYGALEKSNAGTEDAPLSKSAKRKARRSKQLYENSAANPLPVVEVNSTAKPPPVVEVNPPSVLEPVRDLPTEDKSERNENLWSTADIEAEEPLSSYEKFARKGRVEMLDELRGFSQSFKLHAPLPRDLLPILSNDPVKQRHIQAKALNYIDPLKHVEPVLKYYKPSSYEPSLEDAKRSVG